jgi:hypothetical protein
MRFRLVFEGDLAPRQRIAVADVHKIRMKLHGQIKNLWDHQPLSESRKLSGESPPPIVGDVAIMERRDGILFAPLVTQNNNLSCELSILLLRLQMPGQLLGTGGDIDNRIKTLLDALRLPSNAR